jgi:hypothetical protein
MIISIADSDPGSGAFLTPGSGMNFFPDPGFQTHISEALVYNFLGKKSGDPGSGV